MEEEHDEPQLETTRTTPVSEDPSLVAGRYRIIRTLGRGGGGHVWLARDEHLGREVALKRVGGETDSELLLTRGMREARTSASLAHEHVVAVYDAFDADGSPWIVMEYVDGPSLADVLADGRRLPAEQVASIGGQVATALAAAHRAGILHRDVKPGNVLLASPTSAKLTDFGIARAEHDAQLTQTGLVSGTAAYFSPELARGEQPSEASDVWALGVTLYSAVEGRRPLPDDDNAVAQLHTIVREAPAEPVHAGPLKAALAGMLAADPEQRWSAERVAHELGRLAGGVRTAPAPGVWGATNPEADATRAVAPVGATQQVPVAGTARVGVPGTARVPAGTSTPPPARPQPPRSGGGGGIPWLTLLVAIPLLAMLAWAGWHVYQRLDEGAASDTTTSSDAKAAAVGGQEAVDTVVGFYSTLPTGGLEEAKAYLGKKAKVDEGIADGLTLVEYRTVRGTENADGSATVTANVSYHYGDVVLTQDETMRVERLEAGSQPRIVERTTTNATQTSSQEESDEADDASQEESDEADDASQQATDDAADDLTEQAVEKAKAEAAKAREKAAKEAEKLREKAEKEAEKALSGDG